MSEVDRLSPGRLLESVPEIGADVVERLMRLPTNEAVLASALEKTRSVIAAAGLDDVDAAAAPPRGGWAPMRVHGPDPSPFVRRYQGALRSLEAIDRVAVGRALLNADPEAGIAAGSTVDDEALNVPWLPLFRPQHGRHGRRQITSMQPCLIEKPVLNNGRPAGQGYFSGSPRGFQN